MAAELERKNDPKFIAQLRARLKDNAALLRSWRDPKKSEDGFMYIMTSPVNEAKSMVKVGFAQELERRLKEHHSEHAGGLVRPKDDQLKFIWSTPCVRRGQVESAVHKSLRAAGDWITFVNGYSCMDKCSEHVVKHREWYKLELGTSLKLLQQEIQFWVTAAKYYFHIAHWDPQHDDVKRITTRAAIKRPPPQLAKPVVAAAPPASAAAAGTGAEAAAGAAAAPNPTQCTTCLYYCASTQARKKHEALDAKITKAKRTRSSLSLPFA